MSDSVPKSNSNKSSVDSGVKNTEYASKVLGGYPSEKSVKEIQKVNSPSGRSKAPGSVRV